MAKARGVPKHPQLYRVEVLATQRLTKHLHRVTVGGTDLATFAWLGFDHWFRLFAPRPHQARFELPDISGPMWWRSYLQIPEDRRPLYANYTVADLRLPERELDVHFVLHAGPDGEPAGPAAIWACGARPGDQLALLDQGIMFEPPPDTAEVTIVADESGLPAVTGILRSLPADAVGRVIQEVPSARDRRELLRPAGIGVTWIEREDDHVVAGARALAALRTLEEVHRRGYAFVVGESTLATEGRRHLHRIGLPKNRITFCGFWRHQP